MGKKILVKNHLTSEVGAGALERERAKKKECKKSESAERERKKREFALFPPPTVEIRFQSPKPLGRGKKGS
jgi:hypothetical protein